jgi:hypothetical protein
MRADAERHVADEMFRAAGKGFRRLSFRGQSAVGLSPQKLTSRKQKNILPFVAPRFSTDGAFRR